MAYKHVFGKPISLDFYPQVDDEDIGAAELVSARIYSEQPTEAQFENIASGHIEEVPSWLPIADGGYRIAFAALVDSEPSSSEEYEKYFVVISFKYVTSGATKHDLEQIFVYRPDSLTSRITLTVRDVYSLESRIEELAPTQQWVEDKIREAIEDIISKLEARGYRKRSIFNFQKLNLAAARLACSFCCFDFASEGNQFWATKAERWETRSNTKFDSALIGVDISGDDKPDIEEKRFGGAVYVMR